MKRLVIWMIIILAAALTAGFIAVIKMPPGNEAGFSKNAVDPAFGTFSNIIRAKVLEVVSEEEIHTQRFSQINQTLRARLLNGDEEGAEVMVEYEEQLVESALQKARVGDTVVVGKIQTPQESSYVLIDRYRAPSLIWLAALFIILVFLFGGFRGLTSIVGLGFSILVLIYFIAPNILAGKSPSMVTIVGAGIIALVSMFLAHGFKVRTGLALMAITISLAVCEALAYFVLIAGKFFGTGSDEALFLQQGFLGGLNLRGILLAGIIISALGVLDDVASAQAATVEEIHTGNPSLSFRELFTKAGSVGKEHIASLVNTLVLAYAGASLPLFLLFTISSNQPLWALLNSETIAEEIIRTLVGSTALIIAVPLTTLLTAAYFKSLKQ
jgi:uncharacterized membrane protein